jgi:hypothetical protein
MRVFNRRGAAVAPVVVGLVVAAAGCASTAGRAAGTPGGTVVDTIRGTRHVPTGAAPIWVITSIARS